MHEREETLLRIAQALELPDPEGIVASRDVEENRLERQADKRTENVGEQVHPLEVAGVPAVPRYPTASGYGAAMRRHHHPRSRSRPCRRSLWRRRSSQHHDLGRCSLVFDESPAAPGDHLPSSSSTSSTAPAGTTESSTASTAPTSTTRPPRRRPGSRFPMMRFLPRISISHSARAATSFSPMLRSRSTWSSGPSGEAPADGSCPSSMQLQRTTRTRSPSSPSPGVPRWRHPPTGWGIWFSPDRLLWGYSDDAVGVCTGSPDSRSACCITSDGFEVDRWFGAASEADLRSRARRTDRLRLSRGGSGAKDSPDGEAASRERCLLRTTTPGRPRCPIRIGSVSEPDRARPGDGDSRRPLRRADGAASMRSERPLR